MKEEALLVTNPTNIRYLTGFVNIDPRDAYVLLVNDKKILFTNSLYIEQAKRLSQVDEVIQISRESPLSSRLIQVLKKENVATLEFESTNLTVAEHTLLQEKLENISLQPSTDRIESRRMIKTKEEITHIRTAAAVTDQCFTYILSRIKPGITEGRLAWEIESYLKLHAGDLAFTPIVAFNAAASQPHYQERANNPLRRGSLILLDFGARVNGYCADMTRVVFLGEPKKEWVDSYAAVLAAEEKALELLRIGERDGKIVDQQAQEVLQKANQPIYPHSLGHAVGLDIHEAPRLSIKRAEILKTNMVVTVEPGVYIEGAYGIRIEDLVLLKDKSIEVLSQSKKELIII